MVVEPPLAASGLDFLASTASLFTKMQRSSTFELPTTIKNDVGSSLNKIPITTVYSQEAPNSSRLLGKKQSIIVDLNFPETSISRNQQNLGTKKDLKASNTSTSLSSLNRRYYSTAAKTSLISSSNTFNSKQTTQEFFKQQVDNGLIDKGVTLGSILANPDLRSKLFNATPASSSNQSTQE